MKLNNWFTVEYVDPKFISESDFKKIHEIEQDTWASHIWEYVKCICCWKIHSKQDIFGHLSKDIFEKTVTQIEQILWSNILCHDCGSITEHIFWEEYRDNILERYNESQSFLSVYRDEWWEIRWFADWYIADLETIYRREFEQYYSGLWIQKVWDLSKNILKWDLPQNFFMHSCTCMEPTYTSLENFFIIARNLYYALIHAWFKDIMWIYEASIWSQSHAIFHALGAKKIGISDMEEYSLLITDTSFWKISDIFIHENIVYDFVEKLSLPVKIFLKLYRTNMKEILAR